MSETLESLRRQIGSADKLGTVVRTMKALAASNIGHYERAVASLASYRRSLELGLGACLRQLPRSPPGAGGGAGPVGIIAFGSDQGLVGDFNERLAREIAAHRADAPGPRVVWTVGERLGAALEAVGLAPRSCRGGPYGIEAVTPLVGELLLDVDAARRADRVHEVHVFANEPGGAGGYRPCRQRLLPLDHAWRTARLDAPWPTPCLPQALGGAERTLAALVRQHLFVEIFAACARSLAAENLSRLLAMQRAEHNIEELLEDLARRFHRHRQSAIDDELFDVVAGFEALAP